MTPQTTAIEAHIKEAIKLSDEPTQEKKSLFCLWYRERRNPHPQTKHFWFNGDLRAAIARGRTHCEAMNLVFIHVRPFVSDLDMEEKRQQGAYD